jgi:hypothetical protein
MRSFRIGRCGNLVPASTQRDKIHTQFCVFVFCKGSGNEARMNETGKRQLFSRPVQWIFGLGALVILVAGLWFDWIKWLFVCEVQWSATVFLLFLPILAMTTDRALLLGAYDIRHKDHGRYLGFLLIFAAASIVWTGQAELALAESRLDEIVKTRLIPSLLGALVLLAAVVLNLVVTHKVSAERSGGKKFRWQAIDSRMLQGVVFGIACFLVGQAIIWLLNLTLCSNLPPPMVDSVQGFQSWIRRWLPPQLWKGYIGQGGQLGTEASQIGLLILLLASFYSYWRLRRIKLPPLCCIALLTIVLVWLFSGFAFFFQIFRVPTFLPVVVWLLVSSRHPKADHFYEVLDGGIQPTPSLKFLEVTGDDPRIVVVASAGGGIQAAAWTAQVLAGLDSAAPADQQNSFRTHLRAVSGVSGGSVGLMYYLAAQASGGATAAAAEAAAESSLSEVTDALIYEDLKRAFCPFLIRDIYGDRGKALERAWIKNGSHKGDDAYKETLKSATLKQWAEATARGDLPAVILNSTIVEEGQRLAFSSVPLSTAPGFSGFSEFTRLYPAYDIHVSTAARLSAAFTFVSPAARPALRAQEKELRKMVSKSAENEEQNENLHLVDGGYLDNSGITALIQLLSEKLAELGTTSPDRIPKKILLLLINAFPLQAKQFVKSHRGTFYQFWAPLLTLFTVRSTAHDAMAQRELILFRDAIRALHGTELSYIDFRFSTAVLGTASAHVAKETPPLSWHLTDSQKKAIAHAWEGVTLQRQKTLEFLKGGVLPPWP